MLRICLLDLGVVSSCREGCLFVIISSTNEVRYIRRPIYSGTNTLERHRIKVSKEFLTRNVSNHWL